MQGRTYTVGLTFEIEADSPEAAHRVGCELAFATEDQEWRSAATGVVSTVRHAWIDREALEVQS